MPVSLPCLSHGGAASCSLELQQHCTKPILLQRRQGQSQGPHHLKEFLNLFLCQQMNQGSWLDWRVHGTPRRLRKLYLNSVEKRVALRYHRKPTEVSTDTHTTHPRITDITGKWFHVQKYLSLPGLKKKKKTTTLNYNCFFTIRATFTRGISARTLCHRKCHDVLLCQWKLTYFKNSMLKIIALYQTSRVSRMSLWRSRHLTQSNSFFNN